MLRACLLLALGTRLHDVVFSDEQMPLSPMNYRTYIEMAKYLLELNATYSDVVRVSVAQETYHLPYPPELQCIIDDKTNATELCKQFVVHITNHSTLVSDPERPEVFISGALHGDERVGPNAAIELVALFAHATSIYETDDKMKPTVDTQRWLKELVNTRNVLVMPMTNAYGYSRKCRRELEVDPNRDYNYMRSGVDCMKAMTSRVVNEIWRDHVFQLAVTFHGGTRAVAYEWGSPDHYLRGNENNPSEKSPDHMAQFQIGNTLANFAGIFPDGKLYPTGTMNDVVYGVTGGMEDWGYAASWENQFYDKKLQPFRPCEPTTFGGYLKEKTTYNNITNRAFNMLVETSDRKEPEAVELGKYEELYKANVDFFRTEGVMTEFIGHVPRNVRLALMMIEMVQPFVRWVDSAGSSVTRTQNVSSFFPAASLYTTNTNQVTEMGCGALAWERNEVTTCNVADCSVIDGRHSKLQIAWEVLGALTVDSTYVQVSSTPSFDNNSVLIRTTIQKGTTRRFYELASNSSQAAAANATIVGTSLFVTCLDLANVTSNMAYIRAVATVDQDWIKHGDGDDAPSPRVPPQSHLVNARTNLDWKLEWNGHRVKSTLDWTSRVITVYITKSLQTDVALSNTSADVSPLHTPSSLVALIASSQSDSEDSEDSGDTEDSSDEMAMTTKPANAQVTDENDKLDVKYEAKSSQDNGESDETALDDESKMAASDDDQDATLEDSSFGKTPNVTALATTGSSSNGRETSSSLLRFGYLTISSCAMIVVVTLAYLYQRVFRRARQPYINISSLEQVARVTINSIDDEEYKVDDDDSDDSEGPRIPRHAQSSRSVL
ncbi:unnamed protein product [Peronospora belbahrii]|uniref:Peptidase M14 domain-containing protein n=1 Tax=Peronospora belbahrii TaxID=622444 RepID=A0ABN8D741_9STRA|nr:unnamed protein product [Peronospora belbahrii]